MYLLCLYKSEFEMCTYGGHVPLQRNSEGRSIPSSNISYKLHIEFNLLHIIYEGILSSLSILDWTEILVGNSLKN